MHGRLYRKVLAAAVAVVLGSLSPAAAQTGPTVTLDAGTIRGVASAGVLAFKGIPYAAPPVGGLRWRAPQPVTPWDGVREATAYGNDCVQRWIPGDAGASGSTQSENCLVLNVWCPATFEHREKHPVLVWIHGGGFLNGSASAPFFDGSRFARDGVVLVSFHYRLGRLGFFAHPALTTEDDKPLANYALLDQLAALQWVQKNIGVFGGDPSQVTIAGESAGGISVLHLLTWPAAGGLFHRAAVLSGGGRSYVPPHRKLNKATGPLPSAEDSGVAFAESVGITDTGEAGLKALRSLPAETVSGDMSMAALLTKPPTYAGGPINDGEVVTATPEQKFLRGDFAKVPLIIGTTGDDIGVVYPPDRSRPFDFFGPDAERAHQLYDPDGKLPVDQLASVIAEDMTMHEPARFVAKHMTAAGMPAWLYRFGYVADSLRPKMTGAEHASELAYLFDQMEARFGNAVTDKDRVMAQTFHRYFVNFARSGDPNGAGLPVWSQFDPTDFDLMLFTNDGEAKMQADPWRERLAVVERAIEREAASRGHHDAETRETSP